MNEFLRFGDGVQPSVQDDTGLLGQPFLKASDGSWKKLTFGSNGLDEEIRMGYDGGSPAGNTRAWNAQGAEPGELRAEPAVVVGAGVLSKSIHYTLGSTELKVTRQYKLCAGAKVAEFKVSIEVAGAPAPNLRIWLGTRDDFIAGSDRVKKQVGTFVGDGVYTQADPDHPTRQWIKASGAAESAYVAKTGSRQNTCDVYIQ